MNLQALILEMAPPFRAAPRVPLAALRDHPRQAIAFDGDGAMIVWDGASERTIYGDPRVNHAFRAWHDACHLAGGHDFTLAGETAACERQILEARKRYGRIPREVLALIRAEVIGQATYFHHTGMFPIDQIAFVRQYTAQVLRGE